MPLWKRHCELIIQFLEGNHAGLGVGVKVHLLTVLDAFALPATIIGFKLGHFTCV